ATLHNDPANNQRQQTMGVSSFPFHNRLDCYLSGRLRAPSRVEPEHQKRRCVKLLAHRERAVSPKPAVLYARKAEVIALRHFTTKLSAIRVCPRPLDEERFVPVFGDDRNPAIKRPDGDFVSDSLRNVGSATKPSPLKSRDSLAVEIEPMPRATVSFAT